MALIQSSRPSGGGGGGIAIRGWQVDVHTQTENFTSGSVVITLSHQPATAEAIAIDYNGQKLLYNTEWIYGSGGNSITILFSDPYVTDYDAPPVFQIQYPYV